MTMQFKFGKTESIIRQLASKEMDIFQEELIKVLMCELLCERRKAMEIMKAVITKFPYKEGKVEGRNGYLFNKIPTEINP